MQYATGWLADSRLENSRERQFRLSGRHLSFVVAVFIIMLLERRSLGLMAVQVSRARRLLSDAMNAWPLAKRIDPSACLCRQTPRDR